MLEYISSALIPIIVFMIMICGINKNLPVYDTFAKGAINGLTTVKKIFPHLLAMIICVGVLRSSGLIDFLGDKIAFILKPLNLDPSVIMLGIMRPLSGAGSTAILSDILKTFGPDSFTGLLACVMMGSTETTFYVISLYLGSVNITNYRYLLKVCLTADAVGIISSVIISNLLW